MIAFGANVAAPFLMFTVHRNTDKMLFGCCRACSSQGLYSRALQSADVNGHHLSSGAVPYERIPLEIVLHLVSTDGRIVK